MKIFTSKRNSKIEWHLLSVFMYIINLNFQVESTALDKNRQLLLMALLNVSYTKSTPTVSQNLRESQNGMQMVWFASIPS